MKETNHVLSVEDFDLFEELDAIADQFAGVSKSERRLLNQPFDLCGIKFYPLTVAKSLWYAEKCEEWELSGTSQDSFLFWLLSLPNDETSLDTYSEFKAANKAVKRLSRKLHCTNQEMTDIYKKCLGITGKESTGEATDTDYGVVIACLLREYGGTAEEWLYHTPVEMIATLFKAYADRINAENNAGRKVAGKNGKAVAPQADARMIALSKFRKKCNEIKELWNGK